MKRPGHIALLFLLLLPVIGTGKKRHAYTATEIRAISDSLLRNKIGDTLFQYCKWDNSSYYIWQKGEKQNFVPLAEREEINRRFTSANVAYVFTMPYNECAAYDTVSGTINLVLQKQDSIFSLESDPDVSFIPRMALLHEACNFLSMEDALLKATQANIQSGITPAYATLEYIPATGQFVWIVQSLLWEEKNFNHEHEPKKDIVIINATTGDVLKHTTLLYTQVISDIF